MMDQFVSFIFWASLNVFAFSFWLCTVSHNKRDDLFPFLLNLILSGLIYTIVWLLFNEAKLISPSNTFEHLFKIGFAISFIVAVSTFSFVKFLFKLMENPSNSFKIFGTPIGLIDRGALIILTFWLLSLFITLMFANTIKLGYRIVNEGFYLSWLANVFFYSVLGGVIGVLNFKRPVSDPFEKRLSVLFSSADSEIKNALGKEIRKLGVFVKSEKRHVEVIEYSDIYKAYKLRIKKNTTLVNVFYDVSVADRVKFNLTPDKFDNPNQEKPDLVGQITSIRIDSETENLLNKPIELKQGPNNTNYDFSVQSAPLSVEIDYWWWMSIFEKDNFSPSRYTEFFETTVTNNISEENNLIIPVGSFLNESEEIALKFGRSITVSQRNNIHSNQFIEVFKLARPTLDQA